MASSGLITANNVVKVPIKRFSASPMLFSHQGGGFSPSGEGSKRELGGNNAVLEFQSVPHPLQKSSGGFNGHINLT
jgi:hypothetical protein